MVFALTAALVVAWTPDPSKFSGVLLEAAPPPAIKLALPGFKGADISPEKAAFFAQHFATELGKSGVQVTTSEDMQAVIGFERQKQLLGCADESASCMTEIANALGVDGLIIGSIAKLDGALAVNLKVVDATDGKTLAQYSADSDGEKAAMKMLSQAAKDIADQLQKSREQKLAASQPQGGVKAAPPQAVQQKFRYEARNDGLRQFGKYTMIGSGVLLGLGIGSLVVGAAVYGGEPAPGSDAEGLGATLALLGLIELVATPGTFLVGLVCYLLGDTVMVKVPVAAGIVPTRNGGAVAAVAFRF